MLKVVLQFFAMLFWTPLRTWLPSHLGAPHANSKLKVSRAQLKEQNMRDAGIPHYFEKFGRKLGGLTMYVATVRVGSGKKAAKAGSRLQQVVEHVMNNTKGVKRFWPPQGFDTKEAEVSGDIVVEVYSDVLKDACELQNKLKERLPSSDVDIRTRGYAEESTRTNTCSDHPHIERTASPNKIFFALMAVVCCVVCFVLWLVLWLKFRARRSRIAADTMQMFDTIGKQDEELGELTKHGEDSHEDLGEGFNSSGSEAGSDAEYPCDRSEKTLTSCDGGAPTDVIEVENSLEDLYVKVKMETQQWPQGQRLTGYNTVQQTLKLLEDADAALVVVAPKEALKKLQVRSTDGGYMKRRLKHFTVFQQGFQKPFLEFCSHKPEFDLNDRWPPSYYDKEARGKPKDGAILLYPSGRVAKCSAQVLGLVASTVRWPEHGLKHATAVNIASALRKHVVVLIKSSHGKTRCLLGCQEGELAQIVPTSARDRGGFFRWVKMTVAVNWKCALLARE